MDADETVRMDVVVEAPWLGEWTPPWPVAAFAPDEWMVLHGGVTPEEVGSVVARLVLFTGAPKGGTARRVLERLSQKRHPGLPGGVRVRDGAGNEVLPDYCGVGAWREWLDLTDGKTQPWLGDGPDEWLGDQPAQWLVHTADAVRVCSGVWVEAGHRVAKTTVVIPRAELPRLLAGMEADVRAFLPRLREWAVAIDPEYGARLAERFEAAFVAP